jgi:hypothetical protein
MRHRIWKLIGPAAVVGGVIAPTAALAERDYPTPSSTRTVSATATETAEPTQVGGAQAARPVRSGSTLPFTGVEITALALTGAGVTGAGLLLVALGRRRSHANRP